MYKRFLKDSFFPNTDEQLCYVYNDSTLFSLHIANTHTSNVKVSLYLGESDIKYAILKDITVPSETTLQAVDSPMLLKKGDTLYLSCDTQNGITSILTIQEV